MKYISTLLLLVLLGWTWSLATTERDLNLDQHKHVEAGVEDDIRTFVKRRFPYVNDLFCTQLYTETVQPGTELIARFRCNAQGGVGTEEATEQVFEGFLRLRSTDNFQTWAETGGEIHQKELRFLNEIRVVPTGRPDPNSGPTPAGEK